MRRKSLGEDVTIKACKREFLNSIKSCVLVVIADYSNPFM